MHSTSTMRGTLRRTYSPSASNVAAISLSTEFFAPPISTVPGSGPDGRTTIWSTIAPVCSRRTVARVVSTAVVDAAGLAARLEPRTTTRRRRERGLRGCDGPSARTSGRPWSARGGAPRSSRPLHGHRDRRLFCSPCRRSGGSSSSCPTRCVGGRPRAQWPAMVGTAAAPRRHRRAHARAAVLDRRGRWLPRVAHHADHHVRGGRVWLERCRAGQHPRGAACRRARSRSCSSASQTVVRRRMAGGHRRGRLCHRRHRRVRAEPRGPRPSQTIARAFSTTLGLLILIVAAEEMPAGSRAYAVSILAMTSALGSGVVLWALPLADLGPGWWRILYVIPLSRAAGSCTRRPACSRAGASGRRTPTRASPATARAGGRLRPLRSSARFSVALAAAHQRVPLRERAWVLGGSHQRLHHRHEHTRGDRHHRGRQAGRRARAPHRRVRRVVGRDDLHPDRDVPGHGLADVGLVRWSVRSSAQRRSRRSASTAPSCSPRRCGDACQRRIVTLFLVAGSARRARRRRAPVRPPRRGSAPP